MIDTLRLAIRDYEIKDTSIFSINKGTIRPDIDPISGQKKIYDTGQKVLLSDLEGNKVFGQKAFLNSPLYQIDVQTQFLSSPCLFIKCSIPKAYSNSDTNIYSAGKNGTFTVIKKIEDDLKEKGIKLNLFEGSLSRVDLFKNINTDYNFSDYASVLENLYLTRSKKIEYRGEQIEGFLLGNKSKQLCIYDKIQEQKSKLNNPSGPVNGFNNLLRAEYRLMKKKVINKALNIVSMKDLLVNYKDVKEYYKIQMGKVFDHDLTELKAQNFISREQAFSLLEYLKHEKKVRNYKVDFLEIAFTDTQINIDKAIDYILEYEKDNYQNQKSITVLKSRLAKKIRERQILKRAYLESNSIPFSQLYNELKSKLTA